jgi:hypothetical protein
MKDGSETFVKLNKDCSVQPDADNDSGSRDMPEKRYKKNDLRSQIGFLFISTFERCYYSKTFYTQIVFSSIVAKVSTLAFSGISESFLRPPLDTGRNSTNIPSSLAALRGKVVCFVFTYLYGSI